MSLNSQDDDVDHKGILWFVLGIAIVVSLAIAIGMGMARNGVFSHGVKGKSASASKQAAASAAGHGASTAIGASSAAAPVGMSGMNAGADEASVKVVDGVVRFYFASGKADVAKGAKEALTEVVAAAKAGKKLVISGYHDSTGSAQANAELAKKRALAVRAALVAEGVAESAIDMKKPEAMPNTKGSDPEARRVEVKIS